MPSPLFNPFPELVTNRLELRKLEPADAHEIYLLRSDERVNKFIDRPKAQSVEDGLRFIHKINIDTSLGKCIFWAIVPKMEEDLVGSICLWNLDRKESKAELGFELLTAYEGKGLMQEALSRVLEFGFLTLDLRRIEAWIAPGNGRAQKLLEKARFRRDETAEKKNNTDRESEMLIYAMTKPYR